MRFHCALARCLHPSPPILFCSVFYLWLLRLRYESEGQAPLIRLRHPLLPILFQPRSRSTKLLSWALLKYRHPFSLMLLKPDSITIYTQLYFKFGFFFIFILVYFYLIEDRRQVFICNLTFPWINSKIQKTYLCLGS